MSISKSKTSSRIDLLPKEIYNNIMVISMNDKFKETYNELYKYIVKNIRWYIYDIIDEILNYYPYHKDAESIIKEVLVEEKLIKNLLKKSKINKLKFIKKLVKYTNTIEDIEQVELSKKKDIINKIIKKVIADYNNNVIIKIVDYIINDIDNIGLKYLYIYTEEQHNNFMDELLNKIIHNKEIKEYMD